MDKPAIHQVAGRPMKYIHIFASPGSRAGYTKVGDVWMAAITSDRESLYDGADDYVGTIPHPDDEPITITRSRAEWRELGVEV